MNPKQFRTQPEEVEAIFLGPDTDLRAVARWCGGDAPEIENEDDILHVPTLKGGLLLRRGEWLVKDLSTGGYYGMEEADFEKKFGARPEVESAKRPPTGFPGNYPRSDQLPGRPLFDPNAEPSDPREAHRHRDGDNYIGLGGMGTPPFE